MKKLTSGSMNVLKEILRPVKVLIILILICFVLKFVLADYIQNLDNAFISFINNHIANDTLTNIMKKITYFGSEYVIVPALTFFIIFIKNRKCGFIMAMNVLWAYLLNNILKHIFMRPRPISSMVEAIGYSFPSSHTMCSVAFYGFIYILIKDKIKSKWLKRILLGVTSLVVLTIAFSRVYLQAHYLSDVIMGIVFGFVSLLIFVEILKKVVASEQKKEEKEGYREL